MKVVKVDQQNIQDFYTQFKKSYFDGIPVNARMQQSLDSLFGEGASPAKAVEIIVGDIKQRGDDAVIAWTNKIDGTSFNAEDLRVGKAEVEAAYSLVDADFLTALRKAIENIRSFHEKQLPKSWLTYEANGVVLGQNIFPLACVGIYVPGGTAAYPSSVLMNAVPAQVAGVERIVMVVPPSKDGSVNPHVLVAANEAGVHEIYKVGGAQAVAALAFGTDTIPKVDKITGPGNIFVTLAKKAVYGYVDIDMLAGPSEILVIADDGADPSFVAADLLSQAEHDTLAASILVTTSETLAQKVQEQLTIQLEHLPRKEIASQSLAANGLIVMTDSLSTAVEIANFIAPEHLELMVRDPFGLLGAIKNAGAVFLGDYTPEPVGDYFAGPNHVLPTGGTARFYSVLNVETFMKKSSIISYTPEALKGAANAIVKLAATEGLDAHANAISIRRNQLG